MKKKLFLAVPLLLFVIALLCGCNAKEINDVYISEAMSNNTSFLADENGNFCDWIELCNPTDSDIDLSEYSLTDDGMEAKKFVFPSVTIKKNGYLVLFADGEYQVDKGSEKIHVPFKLSSKKGEALRLYNQDGVLISLLGVPPLEENVSFGIGENGSQMTFTEPTPGKANFSDSSNETTSENVGETSAPTTKAPDAALENVLINEYSTNNTQTLTDSDGDFVSWVELYNSGETADLSGLFLSDNAENKQKWAFPSGTKIKKNGYLVVYLSGKEKDGESELHASFKLNGKEEKLFLFDKNGKEHSSIQVFDLFSNLSCGLDSNGKTVFFSRSTPGKKNSTVAFDSIESARKTKNKELVITEVSAVNTSFKAPDGETYDYVELLNTTDKKINLKNYKLSDSKQPGSFEQLPNRSVKPGEYVLIFCGEEMKIENNAVYVDMGLNRYGETVYLSDSDGVICDSLSYSRLSDSSVCGRDVSADDSAVYFSSKTPGKANPKTSLSKALSNPVFSKSSTYLEKGEKISISSADGEIRYTLDGSTPNKKSALYSSPLKISKTTVIRARCFKSGALPSDTVSATYVVGRKSSLDVVFLTTDSENLYDYNTGIWADGPGYTEEFPHVGANYWQDWERPATFEYMTSDGVSQVYFDAGISVFGQYSRAIEQKSVAVRLRDKYGPSEICYPFFGDDNINVFSSLVLRNSGQDYNIAHIRDAFCSQVIKGSIDVDFMDYKPVVCYVNGKYHGIYDLREKIDEDYLANHHGVDSENVDLIKGNSIVNSGSTDEYKKLLQYIKTHDVTDDKVYDYICSQIDIDELISYWMCESFFTNTDTGNIRFFRENKKGSKWRWIFFDADWSLFPTTYEQNYIENYLDPNGHGVGGNFDTTIMTNLVKNKKFRKRLIEIHAEHLKTTFSTKRLLKIYDKMIDEIDEEMKYHTKRWNFLSYNAWKSNTKVLREIIEKKRAIFIDDLIESFNLSSDEIALIKG